MDLLLPHLGLLVWTVIAFLLVLFILSKYAWKPILKGLNDREATIAESIASAERVKMEMAQMKNENEAILTAAREERATMIKEAKITKDKMIADAKELARWHGQGSSRAGQELANQRVFQPGFFPQQLQQRGIVRHRALHQR